MRVERRELEMAVTSRYWDVRRCAWVSIEAAGTAALAAPATEALRTAAAEPAVPGQRPAPAAPVSAEAPD